jgi:putative ABC transport system permease protein
VIRYFFRDLLAQFRSGRSLFVLSLLGVALGVASVLSIQIINLNALGTFRGSVRAISGEADLSVLGRTPTISEELYSRVLSVDGVQAAWPLFRAEVTLVDGDGVADEDDGPRASLDVLGFDLFAPLRLPWKTPPGELAAALAEPGWIAVTPAFAEELGWRVGDRFEVAAGSRRVALVVGALVDFQQASALASRRLAVMDIAQAQGLLGQRGKIHQIDLRVTSQQEVATVAAALEETLGPSVRVLTPSQQEGQAANLLSSFRLNLTALSLISLVVGAFLVFSSTQASLVRRRVGFGLLRSLGATRGQLLGLILAETGFLAMLGVAVGIPIGYLAAVSYVDRVSATLTNVYLLEQIETLVLPVWLFPLAALVGLAGAMLGAIFPALDISRKDTRALLAAFTLHERIGAAAVPLFLGGLTLLAVAGVVYWLRGEGWRPGGFVLALGLIFSIPLIAPLLVQQGARLVRGGGFGFVFGFRGLGQQLQTTPFAIAAVAVAVCMMVGVTVMVGSFRRTLEVMVDSTVRADVYVTSRGGGTLAPELVAAIAGQPGVLAVDRLRRFFVYPVSVPGDDRRISLAGVDVGLDVGEARFAFLEGEREEALRRVHEEGAVLVSEPLSRKFDLGVGDHLSLYGEDGRVDLSIAGVYYDFSSEGGAAFIDLATMERHFGPGEINNLALYLQPDMDAEKTVDVLRSRFRGELLQFRSNRDLRTRVLRIFDQTFAVTELLRVMSLLIAVCGITLTLLVMARERVSELALYRALGAERIQIFRTYLGKGVGMALYGLVLGGVGGVLLAFILIFVINRTYFGWTIALHWPWSGLAGEAGAMLIAAAAASVYPAWRAARTPATELRREDL